MPERLRSGLSGLITTATVGWVFLGALIEASGDLISGRNPAPPALSTPNVSPDGLTHNADRSTRLAAQAGQAVAFIFIMLGLYRFFVGANFGGLWLAFIGWFLLDASRSSSRRSDRGPLLRVPPFCDV
jgi:hypothetical protein